MCSDFQTFQLKLLLSLSPNAPLDENLRAVICPALSKIQDYCGAELAMHAFVNLEIGEIHALVIGSSPGNRELLLRELERRHAPEKDAGIADPVLPGYKRIVLPAEETGKTIGDSLAEMMSPSKEVRTEAISDDMLWIFRELRKLFPDEFAGHSISRDDTVLLIPLGMGAYQRLGCIVMWAPSKNLMKCLDDSKRYENLIAFRKGTEQLIVRIFRNFYHMEPHTYLPSYYRIGEKPVALLCPEIAEFDRISEILRVCRHLDDEAAAECLRKLVNRFSETVAQVVEQPHYRGRVDQILGNCVLVVFGEYLDTPDPNPKPVCARAVFAAAELEMKLRQVMQSWLDDDFDFDQFCKGNNEQITLAPAIGIDYGKVVFDYVGSHKKRVYMAVGERVSFVKNLASLAGRENHDAFVTDSPRMRFCPVMQYIPSGNQQSGRTAPILLSQSAYTWSKHVLKERPGDPAGTVHHSRTIRLPGRPTLYSVYELWPENVDHTAP